MEEQNYLIVQENMTKNVLKAVLKKREKIQFSTARNLLTHTWRENLYKKAIEVIWRRMCIAQCVLL